MATPPSSASRSSGRALLAAGLLALASFHAVGRDLFDGWAVHLGWSLNDPAARWGGTLLYWRFCGLLAVICVVVGLGILRPSRPGDAGRTTALSERGWILVASLSAALIPLALGRFLLGGAPLTDDASGYLLMARLLGEGRVAGLSPPFPLFFDNRFLVNDGSLYAHFFLGWPALLAPAALVGLPELANPIATALTVPPLYLLLRRLAGRRWAALGPLLVLVSPMLMLAGATLTSHPSCLAVLAWLGWHTLGRESRSWRGAWVGALFSAAFFIRPLSALGVGLPLLVFWGVRRLRERDVRGLVAFVLPSLILAGAFLGANRAQTGSAWTVAYQAAYEYAESNGFRFSLWEDELSEDRATEFRFAGPSRTLAILVSGLLRLDVSLLGWPLTIPLALAAGFAGRRAVLWAAIACFLLVHAAVDNVGIDTFAPMHFYELAWPLLVLVVAGLADLDRWARESVRGGSGAVPVLTGTLVVTALVGFTPVRLWAAGVVATDVAKPLAAAREAARGGPVVVFTQRPFVAYCTKRPLAGWVFERPNNDPGFHDPILWANHLAVDLDRRLVERVFPERRGFLLRWTEDCRAELVPLERLAPDATPDTVPGLDALRREMGLPSRPPSPP